ncbi:MAG: DNA gyrase subunit A [Thermoanaerobaculia bacterium]
MTDILFNREERIPVAIEKELKRSYLDYAMSVIIGRALPDVRDGLKPVHRRILYGMWEQGCTAGKPYRKSARIVGDVMGKYHPHGDAAIYDTLVRMAQPFSMRHMLVDGQGNFGSVDGDSAAAMRYTEIRLTRLAEELMRDDIDKETIDWTPNYDGSLSEPSVLPAKFPNLLVNGSSGIAVGMATNIPPHNLGEVIDACLMMIENPSATWQELMTVLPGPEFPTGGFIHGLDGIRQAYRDGRGIIQVRGRAGFETTKKGDRQQIVITEIPYMTNKARLIEKIAELVRDKRIEGISDLRDESDRDGIRVVVELKRGEVPEVVLNNLYRNTQLQTTFGIIFLAIVENRPEVMSLPTIVRHFIEHRKEIVVRRTRFELRKAEERAHILEGLVKALDILDELIAFIRASRGPQEAKAGLIERFAFTEVQATAILGMRLQQLTGLEREKIANEYNEILALIRHLREILASEKLVLEIISDELKGIKDQYGDKRRTEIIAEANEISIEDMIADTDMVITVSRGGYIKRSPLSMYRAQRRGGKGRIGMQTKEEDIVEHLFVASTHAYVLVFSDKGRMYWLKVHTIPEVGSNARGKAIVNLLNLEQGENVRALLTTRDFSEGKYVVMATRGGKIKKTEFSAFSNVRNTGIIAIDILEGDDLYSVALSDGNSEIFIGTHAGRAIRFHENDVRAMGRGASGVKGISLRSGDSVVEMDVLPSAGDAAPPPPVDGADENAATTAVVAAEEGEGAETDDENVTADWRGYILTVTEKGFGKRSPVASYRLQSRGGMGVINIKTTDKNGKVAGISHVIDDDQMLIISEQGMIIRFPVAGVRSMGRNTQGVRLINIEEGDKVVAAMKIVDKEQPEDSADAEGSETPVEPDTDTPPTDDDTVH